VIRAARAAPRGASSHDIGFGAPKELISFIQGAIELRPSNFKAWLDGLAGEQASIHQYSAHDLHWRDRSWVHQAALVQPAWVRCLAWEKGQSNSRAVLCRTRIPYSSIAIIIPLTCLRRAGAVSGVVDWINASRGLSGLDVALCRTDLAMMFGPALADQFLGAYLQAANGF